MLFTTVAVPARLLPGSSVTRSPRRAERSRSGASMSRETLSPSGTSVVDERESMFLSVSGGGDTAVVGVFARVLWAIGAFGLLRAAGHLLGSVGHFALRYRRASLQCGFGLFFRLRGVWHGWGC